MARFSAEKYEYLFVTVLILTAFWFYTLPIQDNRMPFGDVDSAAHFALSDYMSKKDVPMYYLPGYLNNMYGSLADGKIWYSPQFHLDGAISQIVGGDRIVSFFLFIALASSLFIFSTYIIVRDFYGFLPAFIASFALIFSARDYMTYLWALWPEKAAFAFVPAVLYSFYKYTESYLNSRNKEKRIKGMTQEKRYYIIISVLLLATQFFMHPQAFGLSLLSIALFTLYTGSKEKAVPFNIKTALAAGILFAVIMAPFIQFPLLYAKNTNVAEGYEKVGVSTLFKWYPPYELSKNSVPKEFFSFSDMIGIWVLPLIILGILFLALKRRNKDILMLSWLISIYICYHLGILGFTGRIHRFLAAESHIFFPLAAVGAMFAVSFFNVKKEYTKKVKAGIAAIFVLAVLTLNAPSACSDMKNAYSGYSRMMPNQYNAAVWMEKNIPDNSMVQIAGTLVPAKKKWIGMLSFNYPVYDYKLFGSTHPNASQAGYLFVDYSDIIASGQRNLGNALAAWEKNVTSDGKHKLVYNTNMIRVYKVEK